MTVANLVFGFVGEEVSIYSSYIVNLYVGDRMCSVQLHYISVGCACVFTINDRQR